MKSILFAFIAILFVATGCQPSEETDGDIATLKSSLAEKKAALKELKQEIETIEAKITKLEPAPEKKSALVTLDTLEKQTIDRFAVLQASVVSDEQASASSEIPGRITSLRVKEGDFVRRGQLIATIDTDVMDDQLAEIKTRLELAKTVFEKQDRLWKQNIGSEIQYLQAKNNYEALEQSYKTMQTQMSKKNVYAPVTGVVDREMLQAGELASPGMPIVIILNTNKLKVQADVPENYLTAVKRGDKVSITFPAIDKEVERRITLVGRSIDPSNRTFKIEMATDNMKGLLKPNLLSEVKIKEMTMEDVIAVPIEIIQQEVGGKDFVYVAKKSGNDLVAEKVYVTKGETADGMAEIKEGLNAGDYLVMLGARTISSGDRLINEKG